MKWKLDHLPDFWDVHSIINDVNDPSKLNVLELMVRCQKREKDDTHEPFCFELFHRAIVNGDNASWSIIYQQYFPLVRSWVRQKLPYDDREVEDVVQNVFLAFTRYYTAEKFYKARHLGSVLKFLKSCVATESLQLIRYRDRRNGDQPLSIKPSVPSQQNVSQEVGTKIEREAVWRCVEEVCNDEKDRIIAKDMFTFGLKPAEIYERYSKLFDSSTEVSKVKRNLLKRLERSDCMQDVQM